MKETNVTLQSVVHHVSLFLRFENYRGFSFKAISDS